jgi:hypothetical protein
MSHKGVGFEAGKWKEVAKIYRTLLGMALERKAEGAEKSVSAAKVKRLDTVTSSAMKKRAEPDVNDIKQDENNTVLPEMKMAEMLGHRIRYFTAGVVIGIKMFVNETFLRGRERFSARRKDGARAMKGAAQAARCYLWSIRDLKA